MNNNQLPDPFPPDWVSDWGEDEQGLWIGLTFDDVRQGFRWIPPGRFLMGSPESEAERNSNETQHEVILTQGYWLADTPVTQAMWQVVMGENQSHFKGPERPIGNISWDDAQRFIARINQEDDDLGLRLPTEAEWEHACRAGSQTPFSFGKNITTEQVNYDGNRPYANGGRGEDRGETVDVKALPHNEWGLFQMHGNVREWCSDWFGKYPSGTVTNPKGPEAGVLRVLRGGSWIFNGRVRSAYRLYSGPSRRSGSAGFRLARGPKVEPRK